MFHLFKHTAQSGMGTASTIRIDYERGLIEKSYAKDGLTCSGQSHQYDDSQLQFFFENEIYWLKYLKGSAFLPRVLDIDCEKRIIYQEYHEPDLLISMINGEPFIDDLSEKVLEMYRFFKQKGVFKCNGSLSNMTHHRGQLQAFDFKWARRRPYGKDFELRSYREWLVKIDPSLPEKLLYLLD